MSPVTPTAHRAAPCYWLVHDPSPNGPTGRCALHRPWPEDCPTCDAYSAGLSDAERTRCEVWTRVMGYHRPVSAFNAGKQAEHRDRRTFRETAGTDVSDSADVPPAYPWPCGDEACGD